jgi:DNA-3-methyladenine glycosylase
VVDLSGPSDEVAERLLGCCLHAASAEGLVIVRLTETEAYAGAQDPASHSYRGRTARNGIMFGAAGGLYVYRSHGLHWCCNVTTGAEGVPSAVLLRSGEVIEGWPTARSRRGASVADERLARGPGNLARTLGITGADNGTQLLASDRLWLTDRDQPLSAAVARGPRVGVSQAADIHWRFWVSGDPSVSAYRRSPRAPAPAPGDGRVDRNDHS